MAKPIAKRKIDGDKSRRSKAAEHIFLLKKNDLSSLSGRRQGRADAAEAAAANRNVIFFIFKKLFHFASSVQSAGARVLIHADFILL